MSLRLQARRATLHWAVAADGGRTKQKQLKKRLIGEFNNNRDEVEKLLQEWIKQAQPPFLSNLSVL